MPHVDAYDVASIADGLVRLAGDESICAELRALGPLQAAAFSMPRYTERVEALYARVLASTR